MQLSRQHLFSNCPVASETQRAINYFAHLHLNPCFDCLKISEIAFYMRPGGMIRRRRRPAPYHYPARSRGRALFGSLYSNEQIAFSQTHRLTHDVFIRPNILESVNYAPLQFLLMIADPHRTARNQNQRTDRKCLIDVQMELCAPFWRATRKVLSISICPHQNKTWKCSACENATEGLKVKCINAIIS
jgi:hypothetical protein